ncbi:MAG: flagellar assembly peptidoglycan hydrolase FlgJ [Pseudomonadota bacterium]|nr:flagellar assembly peptidoglycan hydrolase FlgJ [Pseudomonadota bacterium]MDP1905427.1 flagellar assembly peptidoglycan hydrolase FlgJ [Pseudomonadota bacterium]MDP2352903.1 flagellar assembly peptidoglycan hydrolase FlgJ [Pseudomonadota bacterium]
MLAAGADTLAVDVAGAQALKARAAAGDKGALRAAAQQFESLMIGMMLKSMRETKFSEEDDPMTGGEGVKLYRDLLDQQWAEQLSKGGGLGFADMMVKSLERYSAPVETGAVAAPVGAGLPAMPAAESQASLLPRLGATSDVGNALAPTVSERKRAFLETLRPHAEAAAAGTGVPADYILAHAALESGWGKREITAADGSPSHNLFGIKAGGGWRGEAVETLTTEYRQGMPMKLTQQFRAYADYAAAFNDYAGLLKARYAGALASNDAGGFAEALAAGGYATDPAYAGKLKSVIASVAMAGV